MNQRDWLAERFEENRGHLRAVAYRMLGSFSEADDALQESWLRVSRAETDDIENFRGWLTTVLARVCLNMLQSRRARRERSLEAEGQRAPDPVADVGAGFDPEHEALLADSIAPALLVVLEALSPPERVAFVLHDVFSVSFEEIASVVGRSPEAARQLASRARRRVRGVSPGPALDLDRQRRLVEAFLAAARRGDFEALLTVLDPNVVARADDSAVRFGFPRETVGAVAVGRAAASAGARGAHLALVNGRAGLAVAPEDSLVGVLLFTVVEDRIVRIEAVADAERLSEIDIARVPA
jgi:RNA polymerase sigma-70 factor, ECF subfamily